MGSCHQQPVTFTGPAIKDLKQQHSSSSNSSIHPGSCPCPVQLVGTLVHSLECSKRGSAINSTPGCICKVCKDVGCHHKVVLLWESKVLRHSIHVHKGIHFTAHSRSSINNSNLAASAQSGSGITSNSGVHSKAVQLSQFIVDSQVHSTFHCCINGFLLKPVSSSVAIHCSNSKFSPPKPWSNVQSMGSLLPSIMPQLTVAS